MKRLPTLKKREYNWAVFFGGSVGCMLMLQFPVLYDEIFLRIRNAGEGFLTGLSAEGICFEGFSTCFWIWFFHGLCEAKLAAAKNVLVL